MRATSHPGSLTFAAALSLLLAATGPASGASVVFEPIGLYQLELDGEVVSEEARMFHSREAAAVLVVASQLPHPVVLVPRNKTVQRLDVADLEDTALGAKTWNPEGEKTAVATFEMVDGHPAFELGGKKIRLVEKGPLLGPRTIEEIVAYDPSYAYRAASAQTNMTYIDVLESWPQDVLVKIFFSTQCQVCRELMPGILKVVGELDNPRIRFEFHGMPLRAETDPVGRELGIRDFPTGIVYVEGAEVGRTSGHSWRMPTMAIHNALKGIKVDPEALKERAPGS